MTEATAPASFAQYVAALQTFLRRREEIVARIEAILHGRRAEGVALGALLLHPSASEGQRLSAHTYFSDQLKACFWKLPGFPRDLVSLHRELAAKRREDGLEPLARRPNGERDPCELMAHALVHWDRHRWPGRSGRLTYAHTVFAAYFLQQLTYLCLRIWDHGPADAPPHFATIQRLLDDLNAATPANSPHFVRRAGWLFQAAQGPITRELRPYFVIAARVRHSLPLADRLEIHEAGARAAGGHLRSQIRIKLRESSWSIRDPQFLAAMRSFSVVDYALLIHDVVPLLEAYEAAVESGGLQRRDLADAILQAMSSDPNLFLTRVDLLGPYTMIEDVFIEHDKVGDARLNDLGRAHLERVDRYGRLIGRVKGALMEDAPQFHPSRAAYSAYGLAYGFMSELSSSIALSALTQPPSSRGLTVEDVFVGHGSEEHIAVVKQWEAFTDIAAERPLVEYSEEFAADVFARLMEELQAPLQRGSELNTSLFVIPEPVTVEQLRAVHFPEGAAPHPVACLTTDPHRAIGAVQWDPAAFLNDKNEGRFLASCRTEHGWFGVPKGLLTSILGQGQGVLIVDVPSAAIRTLHLTCPDVVLLPNPTIQASRPRSSE